MHKTLTRALKVSFSESETDRRVATLAEFGMSTKFICEETGLTPCQVSYRLNKAQIKRRDYRDGKNAVAEIILTSNSKKRDPVYDEVEEIVMKELRAKGLK